MNELVAVETEVKTEWNRRFPELIHEKRIRFPEPRTVKYSHECQTDEVYSHFSIQRRKKIVLRDTGNETEIIRHLLLMIETGLCEFLDQESLNNFSQTSRRFYSALSLDAREPVFPEIEDIPRDERTGFDVYYIPIQHQIHRITLVRKHNFGPPLFACFVDGELIILHRKASTLIFLDEHKWRAEYAKELKKYTFYIGETQIGVQPDGENATIRSFMVDFESYAPRNFAIFVGGKCISETERRRRKRQCLDCLTNCCIVLLLPLCLLYFIILFCCVCWATACCTTKKCKVRKYLVAINFTRHKARDVIGSSSTDPSEHPMSFTKVKNVSASASTQPGEHVVDMHEVDL
eukprot:Phypoly_transcript_11566.p1 GENE.Phypoly_transcript_11566~~Phypoly_transcript_11566.p1  ORF type:complete len:348 (+),score=19.72 Phypoly_transcript_11566:122-1165(+)